MWVLEDFIPTDLWISRQPGLAEFYWHVGCQKRMPVFPSFVILRYLQAEQGNMIWSFTLLWRSHFFQESGGLSFSSVLVCGLVRYTCSCEIRVGPYAAGGAVGGTDFPCKTELTAQIRVFLRIPWITQWPRTYVDHIHLDFNSHLRLSCETLRDFNAAEGLPWWLNGKESTYNAGTAGNMDSIPGVQKIPWRTEKLDVL